MQSSAIKLKDVNIDNAQSNGKHYQDEIELDFKMSGKTSIARKVPSAPLKMLLDSNMLKGSTLNYGKGRDSTDSDAIRECTGHCVDYDYTYCRDVEVLGSSYDTVFAGYVTNTLPRRSRAIVWSEIAHVVANGGVAYIAARSDKDRCIKGTPFEDGVITSINTFQKGYCVNELSEESSKYFEYTQELKAKSGFRLIRCSHKPFDD